MSASSSDDETVGDHIFYRDRSEWKDVQPIPQDDENSVVTIDYSPQFTDVFDYFRAVINKGEKSKRALKLTQDAIKLNPANYTVWQYRREILKELGENIHHELNFVKNVISKQPKNYQVWQHRRILVEWLNDPSDEKSITETAINNDAKNYHAWQHRQWVVKRFSLYEGELDFTEKLIHIDVRNNSAWNHRYFSINNSTGFTEDVLKSEIEFTIQSIMKAKENESSWSYLRGLILHTNSGLSGHEKVASFCEHLYESGNRSNFLLSVIIDMCKEQLSKDSKDPKYELSRGIALCEELATKLDPIRKNYWDYIGENLKRSLESEKAKRKVF